MKKKPSPLLLLTLCVVFVLLGGCQLSLRRDQGAAPAPSVVPSEAPPVQSVAPTAQGTASPAQSTAPTAAQDTASPTQSVAPSQLPAEAVSTSPLPQENVSPAPSPDGGPPVESQPPAEAEAPPESAAPSRGVTVYDGDGNAVELSDPLEGPAILAFWTSWCPSCKNEMPVLNAAYEELREDVSFLMVDLAAWRDTVEDASAYLQEQGFTFPVLYDIEGNCVSAYDIQSLPTTFFLDAGENIVSRVEGALMEQSLQENLALIQTAQP